VTGALCRRGCPESHERVDTVVVDPYLPRAKLRRIEVAPCPRLIEAITRERIRRGLPLPQSARVRG
jgi:hypothetical protein